MRLLIASDIHISEHRYLEDVQASLEFLARTVVDESIDEVVLLGDIFDRRVPTPRELRVFNEWLWWVVNNCQATVVVLEGNHDVDRDISSISYLSDLCISGVRVFRPPHVIGHFYFGHEHVSGAKADNGVALSGGKNLDDIISKNPDCQVFAFGDFHMPQVLKESPLCFYSGSIAKLSFAERGDRKRAWIFGCDEYHKNPKLEKEVIIPTRPMLQYDVLTVEGDDRKPPWENVDITDSRVKIIYSGTRGALSEINEAGVKSSLLVRGAKSVRIVYNVTDKSKPRNENITECVSEEQALREFLKTKPGSDISVDRVVGVGLELLKQHRGN